MSPNNLRERKAKMAEKIQHVKNKLNQLEPRKHTPQPSEITRQPQRIIQKQLPINGGFDLIHQIFRKSSVNSLSLSSLRV